MRIDDGKLVLAQWVRTTSKAVAAIIGRFYEVVGDRSAALAVRDVANPDRADAVVAALAEPLPGRAPAI